MAKPVLGRGLASLLPSSNLDDVKRDAQQEDVAVETTEIKETQEVSKNIHFQPKTEPVAEKSSLPEESGDSIEVVDIDSLNPNPYQPRINFDDDKLDELADTIRSQGIIQPIVVRRNAGRLEIVSGERRWLAAKRANLDSVTVIKKHFSDRAMQESALIENISRENLNPIETAKSIRSLQDSYNLSQDDIGKRIGKNRATVSNYLRLLTLPDFVQDLLIKTQIDNGHAKAILSIDGDLPRIQLAKKIVTRGMSVRQAERESRKLLSSDSTQTAEKTKSRDVQLVEEELTSLLGSNVSISLSDKGGKLKGKMTVNITSSEDIDRILSIARKASR